MTTNDNHHSREHDAALVALLTATVIQMTGHPIIIKHINRLEQHGSWHHQTRMAQMTSGHTMLPVQF